MFVSSEKAREIAEAEIRSSGIQSDPLFSPLTEACIGQPALVRDVFNNPSYWTVPVMIKDKVAAFARVLPDGRVAALGVLYRDPKHIEECPTTIYGMDADQALRLAAEKLHPQEGETASKPVFVHDGPHGREAWLIEVVKKGVASRWIFVTPAFAYERQAGELLDEAME